MSNRRQSEFMPDYAVPPGETLLEILEDRRLTQAKLAQLMGRPTKTINEIIKGKTAITPKTAIELERVLGPSASIWLNLEQRYQETLARMDDANDSKTRDEWLRKISYKAMIKQGWIEAYADEAELVENLLSFFGVGSIKAWEKIWTAPNVAYRKSAVYDSKPGSVAAWLRRGELQAQQLDCRAFDARAFRDVLEEVRLLTLKPPEVFVKALEELCAKCGVAVVFVPELPGLPVSGATSWPRNDLALIQLSLRYKTDDHLWFTFFHEAGHILLHGKGRIFLERSSEPNEDQDEYEREANAFAADTLIPAQALNEFAVGRISRAKVETFAQKLGIAPGIVVGRLQHDDRLPFTHLNGLKRKLKWVGESVRTANTRLE